MTAVEIKKPFAIATPPSKPRTARCAIRGA